MTVLLEARHVGRRFKSPHRGPDLVALADVSLSLSSGQTLAIVGKSGSGKSTLMQVLAGFDRPSEGHVLWEGVSLASWSPRAINRARQSLFGFVHQHHHLLADLDARDNVALPLRIAGIAPRQARARAEEGLDRVGLLDRSRHRSGELSGGERQRVGIARALIAQPKIILADEPTGSLDPETGEATWRLLTGLVADINAAMIVVTHHPSLASRASAQLRLEAGRPVVVAPAREPERSDPPLWEGAPA